MLRLRLFCVILSRTNSNISKPRLFIVCMAIVGLKLGKSIRTDMQPTREYYLSTNALTTVLAIIMHCNTEKSQSSLYFFLVAKAHILISLPGGKSTQEDKSPAEAESRQPTGTNTAGYLIAKNTFLNWSSRFISIAKLPIILRNCYNDRCHLRSERPTPASTQNLNCTVQLEFPRLAICLTRPQTNPLMVLCLHIHSPVPDRQEHHHVCTQGRTPLQIGEATPEQVTSGLASTPIERLIEERRAAVKKSTPVQARSALFTQRCPHSVPKDVHKTYQAGYQNALRESNHEIKRLEHTIADMEIQLERIKANDITTMVVWRAGVVGLVSTSMGIQMWSSLSEIAVGVSSS